jgi:alpha-methylacyl-CoA racemase
MSASSRAGAAGPLAGVRAIELGGIGPVPFAAMLLSDMGADVVRVDRPNPAPEEAVRHAMYRGRRSAVIDLKHPDGRDTVMRLVRGADVLIEGFRPGVAERLGVGPDECLTANPRLVYGRMTGWGQEGPLARTAGHDIDYIALAGALGAIGPSDRPPMQPVNLLGDFGGGGMLLAFGVVCALHERTQSGRGQVVDAAMVDGVAVLATMLFGLRAAGFWHDERGTNRLDGGAFFYNVYECADGRFAAIGALEPQFYAELRRVLELDDPKWEDQWDEAQWPARRADLAEIFRQRTRDEWTEIFAGSDACFAPVLSLAEAPEHPHNRARGTFDDVFGVVQPAPAPRFSATPGAIQGPPAEPGEHTDAVLAEAGLAAEEIASLRRTGAIA